MKTLIYLSIFALIATSTLSASAESWGGIGRIGTLPIIDPPPVIAIPVKFWGGGIGRIETDPPIIDPKPWIAIEVERDGQLILIAVPADATDEEIQALIDIQVLDI